MTKTKFLLIREIAAGLWHEMHHVLTQLLAAEILQRIPVVYWGEGSLYASSDGSNAFEQFFLPVSGCNVHDLAKEEFSFYPKRWNSANILLPNPHPIVDDGHGTDHLAECDADVCVRDTYIDVEKIIPFIPEEHPLYGLNRRDLFYHLIHKYIRLQKEVRALIDAFYDENMKGTAFLAVHIRSSDKIVEVRHLHELNSRYPREIEKVLQANPGIRIFLMTDCIEILEEYKKRYGDLLIHTECRRVPGNGQGVHFQEYPDNRRKGFEIILDTWLAARCDFFIGNGYSNVSAAVSELKNWKNDRIKLLY
ncbi:MAG: hypothetical protein GX494_06195 [Clostridiaceae bacterium]|mgnify:CR=1 FL=1|jgi:hypothetical protein|nr:hypothetical protein [Clostridiaceae bacterium]